METSSRDDHDPVDRALMAGEAGRVSGERQERPDPEVPEEARRRTFTAQYKLDVVARTTRRRPVRKVRCCAGKGSIPATWSSGGGPVPPAGWPARPGLAAGAADPRDAQIARLTKEKAKLEGAG